MKWSIHHVNLQTHDVAESRSFYRDVLGLSMGSPHNIGSGSTDLTETAHMFDVVGDENRGLHLTKPIFDFSKRSGFPINPAVGGHLAITVEDLDAVKRNLDTAGIFYVDAGRHAMGDVSQIYLYDPSGNMIEINGDPSPAEMKFD